MLSEFLAYPQKFHALETVMRIQAVKRWHMIDTTRIQNLAEHTANVALLAMTIAKTAPINWFDAAAAVAAAALVHDIPESFTGDIPTHTKRHLSVTNPVFDFSVNDNSKCLIKLCDLADGIRFIRLHGVDMTAEHARSGLEEQYVIKLNYAVIDLNWPESLHFHVHENLMMYAYETTRT
jgi:hypothetical protein